MKKVLKVLLPVILAAADSKTYSRLGLHLTCTPQYQSNKLFHH